jgi:NAD(P)H dehydrogenase (quinone)
MWRHTYEVVSKLNEMFGELGHNSTIERLILKDENEYNIDKIELNGISDLSSYDLIIFAAPVNGFRLAVCMKKYMMSAPPIKVPVVCFVTKALPFKWTGGNSAINTMKSHINSSGGYVLKSDVIVWNKKHNARIEQFIQDIKQEVLKGIKS